MKSAVFDQNLIIAISITSLEFAREVLKKGDVFEPDTLNSWYELNKIYRTEYFYQLTESIHSSK